MAYGPDGEVLAVHRKMHLFDIDIPGRITFRESDTLSAGRCVRRLCCVAAQHALYSVFVLPFPFPLATS